MPRHIDPNKPFFSIGAVTDILGIKPRMLRVYEEKGLIFPSRSGTNRRLYSLKDIDILAYIQYLTSVKRVNITGVIEIQKILLKMDENSRNAFLAEIEKEIDEMSSENKKAFINSEEDLINNALKITDTYDLTDIQ